MTTLISLNRIRGVVIGWIVLWLMLAGAQADPVKPMSGSERINDMAVGKDRVWMGTTSGILCLDTITQTWNRYTVEDGLLSNTIQALAVDRQDRLWIGTADGLAVFSNNVWTWYSMRDGLPDNAILSVTADSQGIVWASTEKGLARFDGKTWTSFSMEDLQRQCDDPAAEKTRLSFIPGHETLQTLPSGTVQERISDDSSSDLLKKIIAPTPGIMDTAFPWTILIGTYDTRQKALDVALRYRRKNETTFTSCRSGTAGQDRYEVFIGNFFTADEARKKAKELKKRRFRRTDVQNRLFSIQVMDCVSYIAAEEVREILESLGHLPYSVRCRDTGIGKNRVMLGAYATESEANQALMDLMKQQSFTGASVVVR